LAKVRALSGSQFLSFSRYRPVK